MVRTENVGDKDARADERTCLHLNVQTERCIIIADGICGQQADRVGPRRSIGIRHIRSGQGGAIAHVPSVDESGRTGGKVRGVHGEAAAWVLLQCAEQSLDRQRLGDGDLL